MATIRQITVHYSGKKGLPNYGSVGFDAGVTVDVDEGDDWEELAHLYTARCKAMVVEEIKGALATANGHNKPVETPKTEERPLETNMAASSAYPDYAPEVKGRNSDPKKDDTKHERLDGVKVWPKTEDPGTQRPVTVTYRNEEEPENPQFAPRVLVDVPATATAGRGHGD